jgi:hypothetical protein
MDLHTVTKVCRAQITFGCPKDKVVWPSAESRIAASELDALSRALEVEEIAKGNRVHYCLQFMIAVFPPAENVQQEIDFAGRKP